MTTLLKLTNFLEVTILETFLISIESTTSKSTFVRGAYTEDTSSIQSAWIKDAFFKGAYAKNIYAGGATIVKHSEIDLLFF